MADVRERILVEIENIETVLAHFPDIDKLPALSDLELAGVAALLHSFYNGVENMLKQAAIEKGIRIADGPTWHRDLLSAAAKAGIVSTPQLRMISPATLRFAISSATGTRWTWNCRRCPLW